MNSPDRKSLQILDFRPELAPFFRTINEEWITEMFQLEAKDLKVLENPQMEIIASGGAILFVQHQELGIVGTGGLLKTGRDSFELTKMGVLKSARGLKAGDLLLQALIAKANNLGAKNLYLLTNRKCEAAIHLYLKHGFQHDLEVMNNFGQEYQRCDVAMKYRS